MRYANELFGIIGIVRCRVNAGWSRFALYRGIQTASLKRERETSGRHNEAEISQEVGRANEAASVRREEKSQPAAN